MGGLSIGMELASPLTAQSHQREDWIPFKKSWTYMVWKNVILFFLRYLKIRAYFYKEIKLIGNCDHLIDIFIDMYKNKDSRKLYSSIPPTKKHSTSKIRLKWEKDCGLVISEEDWLNMCFIQSSSTSSGLWIEFCWRNLIRYFVIYLRTDKFLWYWEKCIVHANSQDDHLRGNFKSRSNLYTRGRHSKTQK